MVKFNEDNLLCWRQIEDKEASTYIHFLNCERARHMVERGISDQKSTEALPYNKLLSQLWRSAHTRHVQDIADIDKLIREVKEYFAL